MTIPDSDPALSTFPECLPPSPRCPHCPFSLHPQVPTQGHILKCIKHFGHSKKNFKKSSRETEQSPTNPQTEPHALWIWAAVFA